MAMKSPEDASEMNGANLCSHCSVIRFNDKILAQYIESDFGCTDITDEPPEHPFDYNATDYKDTDSILDLPPLNTWRYRKCPLDYKVTDSLPGLPYLEQSALRGCEFCSLLRLEIMRAGYNTVTGSVDITLAYYLKPPGFVEHGLAVLRARVDQRPDASGIPPASANPNAPNVDIVFAVESDSDVASWLKTPRLRKEDKLCPENIQFMKGVLDRCLRECDHYTAFDFLPSRLLDLGPQMSLDSIRLIDSSQIAPKDGNPAPRYAALSYCWGSPLATDKVPHLCTTMQSMESMKRHVHEQTIPPTILDAINVCKALSIRYLWVDSLCIIQDNKSDWERESLSMTLIYKNAFVTICTPSSKSSNEGFLVQPRRHVAVPFRSQLVPSIYGHYNLVASGTCCQDEYPTWPEMDVDGTSWSSRGWTLQEFQMSNRVLIFGKSMIHFQCHHSVQSENGCQRDSAGPRIIRTLDSYGPEEYPAIYYIEWGSMLYDYQRRLFSVIEDKLPAISGMAKYIADETGDEYLAGLWKSRLPSALVWHADCDNNVKYHIELPDLLSTLYSPKPYISPSWSPVRLDVDVRPKFSFYLDDFETTKLIERSTVVDASVKPIGENPFGRVQGGRIRIRGRLATVSSDLTRLPCDSEGDLWYTLDQGYITYYKLDFFPERNSCNHQGKLSRLLIYSEQTGGTLHEDGHDGAREEARHCLVNHLPSYAANHGSSPNLTIAGCSSQAEQHSDKPESESGSSHSSRLSVAGSSKEIETKIHTQPSPNSDGSPEESKSPPTWDWTDTERTHARIDKADAFGLLIHPLPGTNDYVRVGVWASLIEDVGGTWLYDDIDEQEVDLV